MQSESPSLSDCAKNIIHRLGIGFSRCNSAPPHILFSTDYTREKMRQEIRKKVAQAFAMLEKRISLVRSLDGRPVIIGQEDSADIMHLDFETAYSGIDPEGNVFVSTNDSVIHESATLLFMSVKANGWKIEPILNPNLETAYFKRFAEEEKKCAATEKSSLGKKE